METKTLLKANIKQHKGGLAGIFILMLLVAAALGTVLTVWSNSGRYIQNEMQRAGFGGLTVWISGVPDTETLIDSIESLSVIDRVQAQPLIYADYTANGQESDSEGQLITYIPQEKRYRFFAEDLSGYTAQPDRILQGEVYIPPSMISMFGVQIGDEITFPIARAGRNLTLTVRGFYEDPFMGGSMIGMKGFLISEEDRETVLSILQNAGIDALARDGAMLHIFPTAENRLTVSELNSLLNEQTSISEYSEDVHSKEAIQGFMLILQNAFSGLLLAFAAVLLLAVIVVLSHSIGSTIASDSVNMGILKTMGLTAGKLRRIQLLQYALPVISGLLIGFIAAVPLSRFAGDATLTTTGIRIPTELPLFESLLSCGLILLLLTAFIWLRTRKISRISPMKVIRGETDSENAKTVQMPSVFGRVVSSLLPYFCF